MLTYNFEILCHAIIFCNLSKQPEEQAKRSKKAARGKLEQIAQLASERFSCFLSRHRPRGGEVAATASIKEEGEKRRD
jgi:hypothetical protein